MKKKKKKKEKEKKEKNKKIKSSRTGISASHKELKPCIRI